MGPSGAVVETRQGEYLRIQAFLPGREPLPIGVMLYDAGARRLSVRLRRDWEHIVDPEYDEFFVGLEEQLNQEATESDAEACLARWEDSLSNMIRISDRSPVFLAGFDTTLNRLYRENVASSVQPHRTHLPVYSLKAAAGRWGEASDYAAEPDQGWIEAPPDLRLHPKMFVAQVVGRSMEPRIPSQSWCVFRGDVVGSREGRLVLVENLDVALDQRYTVKRYRSEKIERPDGTWEHERIRLEPLNPEYQAWEVAPDSRCHVIAEFVRLLDE